MNTSQPLEVFGFISLPQKYAVERDVAMSLVALMSFISVVANATLFFVIINDPFKQLRTITAILLAFNSMANCSNSLILFLDNVFYWSGGKFPSDLIVYLGTATTTVYLIGSLLHTVNIYGAIVVPVRYAFLAPKIQKVLIQFLSLTWVLCLIVIMIPPYTLPKNNVPSYVKGILTLICVLLALFALIFGFLYTKIFQTLYARKQRLTLSFHLKRSTIRGKKINSKNENIVKTLFIHVLFFMFTTVPASFIFLIFLHCTTCDPISLQLAGLYAYPICYSSLMFHPFIWLIRLNNYRKAMKETALSIWRRCPKPCKTENNSINAGMLTTETRD